MTIGSMIVIELPTDIRPVAKASLIELPGDDIRPVVNASNEVVCWQDWNTGEVFPRHPREDRYYATLGEDAGMPAAEGPAVDDFGIPLDARWNALFDI